MLSDGLGGCGGNGGDNDEAKGDDEGKTTDNKHINRPKTIHDFAPFFSWTNSDALLFGGTSSNKSAACRLSCCSDTKEWYDSLEW